MADEWLNKKDSYLVKGESLNQIIAMLHILEERNKSVEELTEFIVKLKSLKSYNETLDAFFAISRIESMNVKKKSERQKGYNTLNDILRRLNIRLMNEGADGKN